MLMRMARPLYVHDSIRIDLAQSVYALDAITIAVHFSILSAAARRIPSRMSVAVLTQGLETLTANAPETLVPIPGCCRPVRLFL